nr:unnamed protein product [Digitaria exilis]
MDAHCWSPVAAPKQAGDLDPRHHHRVPQGGDGSGGGDGGGGGGTQQQEADEQQHNHRLLQLHQEVQDQADPPPVPVFQLQQLQAAAAVRQRGFSAEYALLAPMGDAGHSHHHHAGFQPQLLSFGGVGAQHHHVHQFTAQAPAQTASHSRSRGGTAASAGGEIVAATPASHSRVRGGGGGGEIVAVQGGHIVRSTGRKDRHSKVCTARGPRDRRVRLSAHTAIQFYDVQDRLGYDRPSKAVDWLIKNAKDAIDKLEVLPAWQPTATNAAANAPPSSSTHPADSGENSDDQAQAITVAHTAFDFPGGAGGGGGSGGGGFLPASLDSDSIADTIKSFFPMGGTAAGGGEASSSTAAAHSSAMGFQSYTPDLLSRTGSHSQELRLSLQSLPDPNMFHHQQQQNRSSHGHGGGNGSAAQQAIFPGYSFAGGGAMWGGEQAGQRMVPWNVPDPGGGSTGGYLLQQAAHMQAAALAGGQSQFYFQRGPLQSSNNQPSDRGWPETVEADNPMQQQQGGLSSIGFAPGIGFSGFRIPTRIQGDEEHNGGGNGDKQQPPPVSSASHH